MARFAVALFLSLLAAAGARAATITNTNPAPVVLVITEGGNRVEVVIDAGASETLCITACFIMTPDGDRIGLDGSEAVDIVKGSAIVK